MTQSTLVSYLQTLPCPEGYDIGQWRIGSSEISLEFLEKAVSVFQTLATDSDLRKAELRKILEQKQKSEGSRPANPGGCLLC